jgi:1,4-dihydroxy-2-naphthoyl-CoA synthase
LTRAAATNQQIKETEMPEIVTECFEKAFTAFFEKRQPDFTKFKATA